ncbi:MAG: zinc-binding dehydrogenase [Burkholderiales bacterium]|nr:zinc-binding dehydrogenase [Burkholderiales bacterium]
MIETAKVERGMRVLIHGGAGALGTTAVQLAKEHGAHVTATASDDGLALLESLGADELIDYRHTALRADRARHGRRARHAGRAYAGGVLGYAAPGRDPRRDRHAAATRTRGRGRCARGLRVHATTRRGAGAAGRAGG